MKLVRFTVDGRTRLGTLIGDEGADLSAVDPTLPTDLGEALAAGLLPGLHALAARAPRRPLDEVRPEGPIARPPTFLAVGLNYRAHADESGISAPEVPVIFNKAITCVIGPHDPIMIPAAAPGQVDGEVRQDASTARHDLRLPAPDRPCVDGVHAPAGNRHRHRHSGRRRVQHGPTPVPAAQLTGADRDRRHRAIDNPVLAEPCPPAQHAGL